MFGHITLYALVGLDAPKVYLTIVTKREQAVEYAKRILILDHKSHFVQWCKYRKLNCKDLIAIDLYYKDCITDQEKKNFKIVKFTPNKDNIACSLRMFSGSLPLGCSFDTPIEYKYISSKVKRNEFDNNMLDLIEDAAEINPLITITKEDLEEKIQKENGEVNEQ